MSKKVQNQVVFESDYKLRNIVSVNQQSLSNGNIKYEIELGGPKVKVSKIDKVLEKLDDISDRLTVVETKVDNIDKRLNVVETKVDNIDKRLTNVEKDVSELKTEAINHG